MSHPLLQPQLNASPPSSALLILGAYNFIHTYRLSVFSQQENIMERILVILTTILNFVDILVLATSHHHQIFDLSHDYHETMPVGDGGGPPEISLVELEEENGLR